MADSRCAVGVKELFISLYLCLVGISSFADQLEQPLFNTKYLSNQYATEVNKRFKGDLDACLEFYSIFKYSSYTEVKWRRAIDDCVVGAKASSIPYPHEPQMMINDDGLKYIMSNAEKSGSNKEFELLKRELYFFEKTFQFRGKSQEFPSNRWSQYLFEKNTRSGELLTFDYSIDSIASNTEDKWLSRITNFSDKTPFLVHINYFSKEPFMDIARNFELTKLKMLCQEDSVVSFVSIQFKADRTEHEMSFCLNGTLGEGTYKSKGSSIYTIDFLENFTDFLLKELVRNSQSQHYFIFHLKSHGSKNIPIVALNQKTLNKKMESQNHRIDYFSKVSSERSRDLESNDSSFYYLLSNSNFVRLSQIENKENDSALINDPILNSLGNSDLSTNELDPRYSYFSESDLYDFVSKLKEKISLALFFQESCRTNSTSLKKIPVKLIHVFRRAPGIQSYSSLNWEELLEPYIFKNRSEEVQIRVAENKMGLLYFYDSEIDKLMLEKYNKMKIKSDLKSQSRFLPLSSNSSTQDTVSFLNSRAYESDDFFFYPSLIDPQNLFGIDSVFSSYGTNLEADDNIIELRSNSDNMLRLNQAAYLRSYYTTLLDLYQFSSAHHNLFYFFFEGFPFWKKYQFDFHFRLSKIYYYMLQEKVFDNGPIRSDLDEFDQNPYLYAPYAMLNILIHGDRAFKVFNFPKGYKKALTREQELQGVGFTPMGLLYLAYGDKDINFEELGVDSKNLHFFLRKALLLSDKFLIGKIINKYIKDKDSLKQILSRILSLGARNEFYYGLRKEKPNETKVKEFKFYPIFNGKNSLLPFYNEQLLEYEWEQTQLARQLDLSLKYHSFGVPVVKYQNLFASYIENSKNLVHAFKDVEEVIELSAAVGLYFDFIGKLKNILTRLSVLQIASKEFREIKINFLRGLDWEVLYKEYFQSEPVDVSSIYSEQMVKLLLSNDPIYDDLPDKGKGKQLQRKYFDTFRALIRDLGGPKEFKGFFIYYRNKKFPTKSNCSLKLDIPIRGPVPSFRSDIERISFYRMKDIIQDENYFNPESPVSSFSCSKENGFLGGDYSKGNRK
ncbi:MAG: hypothetical protein VX583_04040 [Bdellovibrionota bacterium]